MKINKILLVGEQELNPSIYTYISSFKDSFQTLGYEVHLFNSKRSYIPFLHTMVYRLPNVLKRISNYICNKNLLIFSKKLKPDLIFFIKAENIYVKTIQQLKTDKNKLINFFPDNPLVVWNDSSNLDVLKSIREYDCFLSWSKILTPAYFSIGAKDVYYFPFAFDKNLFPEEIPIDLSDKEKYSGDVCFVGTWEPYREIWLEELINVNSKINLSIWGNQWIENLSFNSKLKEYVKGDAIYFTEMIKVFRLNKIVLNFIRVQNFSSHNMRTIEALASKAFLLTQRTQEQASELFLEGEHLACFSNVNELESKINYYLNNEFDRLLIQKKGEEKVKKYTLETQLAKMIGHLENQMK